MMIWWLGQLPMAKVTLSPDSWLGEIFERCFACQGLTFELWHITMDIPIPVFFGLVTDTANNAIAGDSAQTCRLRLPRSKRCSNACRTGSDNCP